MGIDEELKKFKKFKENYDFKQKEIDVINGVKYCDGIALVDEEGKELGDCEKWINVGYKLKGPYAKIFSNLFPYEFDFRGKHLHCIENFFQGIKFKEKELQDLVFSYSALDSNYIKAATDYDWKKTGIVYWQGKEIDRFSQEYDDMVDELYISAIQNPLYRNALKICNRDIIHVMGEVEKSKTTFTRYEFEKELNCLKDFLKEG